MKVSELIGDSLDIAVALANGWKKGKGFSWYHPERYYFDDDGNKVYRRPDWPGTFYKPSTNWGCAGPIIDKHIGNVWRHNKLDEAEPDVWSAAIYTKYPTVHQAAGAIYSMDGPTALIAICRTYVFSQLGEEISIPKELL